MATMYLKLERDVRVRLFLTVAGSTVYNVDSGSYAVHGVDSAEECGGWKWRVPLSLVHAANYILLEDDGKWKVLKNRMGDQIIPNEEELIWLKLSSKPLAPANHY